MDQTYRGGFTAIVTPYSNDGTRIDFEGLRSLCEFQTKYGISGIVSVGTTGESPTLTWDEHIKTFQTTFNAVGSKAIVIASTGSNSTAECLEGTEHAKEMGIRHVLLVDPYYNGPNSLEIRKEYLEPVASAYPDIAIIPYVIPGRSGTQVLAQDLALAGEHDMIRIEHIAFSRASMAAGALLACKWIASQEQPGIYSMKEVLGLTQP
jgi:4-hydroxy-tetrahydrodipicolinate synthase